MNLKEASILITGGSLGIGKATAALLVENGARVAITGRDKGRLDAAAKATGAFPILADVASPDDIERTYEEYMNEFGKLDCLVNNAGIGGRGQVDEVRLEDFQEVFGVNVPVRAQFDVFRQPQQGWEHRVPVPEWTGRGEDLSRSFQGISRFSGSSKSITLL